VPVELHRLSIGRILAALLLAGFIENWRLIVWVFRVRDIGSVVGAAWLGLVVASIMGLILGRRWGAKILFVLAPYSTVMLATPLLPGMDFFGFRGPIALALWNLLAIAAGVLVLRTPDLRSHSELAA
jgi:hypothetical protein